MQCPRCNDELKASDLGEYGFVIIDVCPKCEGAWFDKGELDRLDDSIWTNGEEVNFNDVSDSHKNLKCPKCQIEMNPQSPNDAKEVVIDRCSDCNGFWLDKGELDQMRDVAGYEDVEKADKVVYAKRPPGCSRLKWAIRCFEDCYFKKK